MDARRFTAFVSYSHAADGKLAPALQQGLQGFAKPWFRKRAMEVFRDDTGLRMTSELWPAIQEALSRSDHLVLLCSPSAAASWWVQREVGWWLGHRDLNTLHLVLTEGGLHWSEEAGTFDADSTTAIPRFLQDHYRHEPLHADARWVRGDSALDLKDARFRGLVRQVVASLRGITPEEVYSEEASALRHNFLWAAGAAVLLAALTVVSVRTTLIAQARERTSLSRKLAAEAEDLLEEDLSLATLFAAEAVEADSTLEARSALLLTLLSQPSIETRGHVFAEPFGQSVTGVAHFDGGRRVLVMAAKGHVLCWDVEERGFVAPALREAGGSETLVDLDVSKDESMAAVLLADGSIELWSLPDCSVACEIDPVTRDGDDGLPLSARAVALSPTGATIAVGWGDGTIEIWERAAARRLGRVLGEPIEARERAHVLGVQSLQFTPDGLRIVSGHGGDVTTSSGACYRVWTLADEEPDPTQIKVGGAAARALELDEDGTLAFVSDGRGAVLEWDLESASRLRRLEGIPGAPATSIRVREGRLFATFAAGDVASWDLNAIKPQLETLMTDADVLECVSLSPADGSFALVGSDGFLAFGRRGHHPLATPLQSATNDRPVTYLAVSRDGTRVGGLVLERVVVWDRQSGRRLAEHPLERNASPFAIGFDGLDPVVLARDGQASKWSGAQWVVQYRKVADQPSEDSWVEPMGRSTPWAEALRRSSDVKFGQTTKAVVAHDGSVVVHGRLTGTIEIERGGTRDVVNLGIDATSAWVGALALTSDADHAAVGLGDGRIVFVNVAAAEMMGPPRKVQRAAIAALEYSPDGAVLASGSRDGTVVLWDVSSQQTIGRPIPAPGANHQAFALTFTDDGEELIVGYSNGGVVRIDVWTDTWVRVGLARANRPMTALEWTRAMDDRPFPGDRWPSPSPPLR